MTFDVRMVEENLNCNVSLEQTDVFKVSMRDITQNNVSMESLGSSHNVSMEDSSSTMDARLKDVQVITRTEADQYDGAYTVDPSFVIQTLQTAQKYLTQNISVNAIEVSSVSNIQGGKTVYIGGIF